MGKISKDTIKDVGVRKYFYISFKNNLSREVVEGLLQNLAEFSDSEINDDKLLCYFANWLGEFEQKDLYEEFVLRFIDSLRNREEIIIHFNDYDGSTIIRHEIPLSNAVCRKSLPVTKALVFLGADVSSVWNSGLIQKAGSMISSPAADYVKNVTSLHSILKKNEVPEKDFFRYYNNDACVELARKNQIDVGIHDLNKVLDEFKIINSRQNLNIIL